MGNLELLSAALEYMEEHLQEELHTEDVARACYCSKSALEKLFRYVYHLGVREYLVRRRMMRAARMLSEQRAVSILDVALAFGYGSNEAFTRAFKQVWNCRPSEFRKERRYSELFPRLRMPMEEGDAYMKTRKPVDISELYDLFKSRGDCYFVCCDIAKLESMNAVSRKAGDMAILETMGRMEEACGEEDIVFRIGGDEFALLTNSPERSYAENIAERIRSANGQVLHCEGKEFPLALHVGVTRFEGKRLKYDELFAGLHTAILDSKA